MGACVLRFRLNPHRSASPIEFELPRVAGETVADLKIRVSERAGPHPSFFLLRRAETPLKLVDEVDIVLPGDDGAIDVLWETCSHGAPAHPITGESPCFWDGGGPAGDVDT